MKISFKPPAYNASEVYAALEWGQKNHLRRLVGDIVKTVGDTLEARIALPKRTVIGFTDMDELAAIRDGSMLFDAAKTLELLETHQPAIEGLAAHEYSHLSDDEVQPTIFGSRLGVIVAEGKADQLANELVGDEEWGIYLGAPPTPETLASFLQTELRTGAPGDIAGHKEVADPPTSNMMPGVDIYGLGYDIVTTVMRVAGSDSIVPIHAQPLEYFSEMARQAYSTQRLLTGENPND